MAATFCMIVGNTKGGTGKTTLAVQLAIRLARSGRDVLLIDWDTQGSAMAAIAARHEAGQRPRVACAHYLKGRVLRDQVSIQSRKFQDVLIDVGGRDSGALRAALVISDLLLVPFLPRSLDVWALADIAALIDDARAASDGLRACAVLNGADPGMSSDNVDAAAALADFPQLTLLDAPIRRRKAFANATGQGLAVEELGPVDRKASEELAALAFAINSMVRSYHISEGGYP